jgi:gas vesicle protein
MVKSSFQRPMKEVSPRINVVPANRAGYNADHERETTAEEWADIQKKIDQEYEKKLKKVGEDAMKKLKEFQDEHHTLQERTQQMMQQSQIRYEA